MSNILIIKHGSLGDIAQASGAIQDIYENHKDHNLYIMTSKPYIDLYKKSPFITDIILDKRLSRFNLIYLYLLMRKIKKLKFVKVFDLQNSSRTSFYKKVLFPNSNYNSWSSSQTTLPSNTTKEEFDKLSVLERFDHQLKTSGLKTKHTLKPNFDWSCTDISKINSKFKLEKYIILFPFCSPHLHLKKWPHYNELIKLIKDELKNDYKVVIAPGPSEIKEAKNFNAECILDDGKALNIPQLASLIKNSSFVISNDTGPAHISAHIGAKGVALFGSHTTAYKVNIEREQFKAIQVSDLSKLSASKVFEKIEL
ncbi:glycosyltransferase family 9 protein [Candidatus Pelagibacter sp.]|nr:glycosyltransferase family 9 protein [Candidatus Pelagibacter sp.]